MTATSTKANEPGSEAVTAVPRPPTCFVGRLALETTEEDLTACLNTCRIGMNGHWTLLWRGSSRQTERGNKRNTRDIQNSKRKKRSEMIGNTSERAKRTQRKRWTASISLTLAFVGAFSGTFDRVPILVVGNSSLKAAISEVMNTFNYNENFLKCAYTP